MTRDEMQNLANRHGVVIEFDLPWPSYWKEMPGVPRCQASMTGDGRMLFYEGDWTDATMTATLLHELGHHVHGHPNSIIMAFAALTAEAEAWNWAMEQAEFTPEMIEWARTAWSTYWDNPQIEDGPRDTPQIQHLQRRIHP